MSGAENRIATRWINCRKIAVSVAIATRTAYDSLTFQRNSCGRLQPLPASAGMRRARREASACPPSLREAVLDQMPQVADPPLPRDLQPGPMLGPSALILRSVCSIC